MADLLTRVKALDPAPGEADLPGGMLPAHVVLRQLDERTKTMQSQLDTQPVTPVPRRPRWKPWWAAAAAFAVVIGIGLAIALLPGGDEPAPVTTPPPTTATTTTTTTSTTAAPLPEEIDLVLQSIEAWNAGDFDSWLEFLAPISEDEQLFPRSLMNANEQIEVTAPCAIVGEDADSVSVECPVYVEDDFHGAGGLASDGTMTFVVNRSGQIVDRSSTAYQEDNGLCCPRWEAFHIAFYRWLEQAHPEVYDDIGPWSGNVFHRVWPPGFASRNPEHMKIALEYVDDFVAQSDVYPLEDGVV